MVAAIAVGQIPSEANMRLLQSVELILFYTKILLCVIIAKHIYIKTAASLYTWPYTKKCLV